MGADLPVWSFGHVLISPWDLGAWLDTGWLVRVLTTDNAALPVSEDRPVISRVLVFICLACSLLLVLCQIYSVDSILPREKYVKVIRIRLRT